MHLSAHETVPLGQSKLRLAAEQLAGVRIGFQRADESREVAVRVGIVVPQHHEKYNRLESPDTCTPAWSLALTNHTIDANDVA